MGVFELCQALLRPHVRNDFGAGVLEGLATSDVIKVVMAVDQILDRLIRHLLDLVDVALSAGRLAVGNRIGGDHTRLGDNEHRLMIDIAENVDVVRAGHLGRFDGRTIGLRLGGVLDSQQATNGSRAGHQQRSFQHGCFLGTKDA